ncbi:hypothetical protein CDAR_23801 [Caerostris darwini]|uniref:Uncharacterized protein n=1 Tax=Caerostris darwini TaxID=1538125 RepID=A0AAV4TZH6_9ARAC|nr:hypothetical protein CDAR_23801 [Caerostris darwini]
MHTKSREGQIQKSGICPESENAYSIPMQNHQTFPLTPGNPPLPAPVHFRAIYDSNYCAQSPSGPSDAPPFHPFRSPIPKVSCRVVIFELQDNYSG